MSSPTGRVVVAMSGGVDSSVAAALLAEQGYDAVGIAMRVFDYGGAVAGRAGKTCCAPDDLDDARAVAQTLGIPFYVADYRELFERKVIDAFADDYLAGRTPNPCVNCNQDLKFSALLKRAHEIGATHVATGHYARIAHDGGTYKLLRGADPAKDQSYFLYGLTQAQLAATLFPVGGMTKAQVREIARRRGLPVSEKPESQDICFVPHQDYAAVIAARRPQLPGPGPMLGPDGERVGEHAGLHHFTIGQRRGLGVALGEPMYVTAIDAGRNLVRIGPKSGLLARAVIAHDFQWVSGEPPVEGAICTLRVRYKHQGTAARVAHQAGGVVRFDLLDPVTGAAPGQSAVAYRGDQVLGGGIIERTVTSETQSPRRGASLRGSLTPREERMP